MRTAHGVVIHCALALAALATSSTHAAPPAAHFFHNPVLGGAVLSPSARHLAVRVGEPGQRDRLAVIDVATKTMTTVASFGNGDVRRFQWVNDKRLVFDTTDNKMAEGDIEYAPGLYAIDRDGRNMLQLAARQGEGGEIPTGSIMKANKQLPWNTFMFEQPGTQDSDSIYVRSPVYNANRDTVLVKLIQVNTRTLKATNVTGPANAHQWLLDNKGEPRVALTMEGELESLHYREPGGTDWRKLASYKAFRGASADSFAPLAFGLEGTLYVEAAAGKDKTAVHTYDLATGKISAEPVIEADGYDFSGSLVIANNKLLGMELVTDAASTVWFDQKMKAIQKEVDGKLGGTVNLVSVASRPELPVVLVTAYSDVQPTAYLLYNTETKEFTRLGASYPAIKPDQMGRQQPVSVKARDGLQLPALLTLPPGEKRTGLPMVVAVHGGPYIRGAVWGWDPQVQFLATRGYAVLEPEFRGSTGFGAAHFKAGMKQWGLAMQDDIADAAKWAIAQGIADPERICIAGASYGGYSALMGLVNDPGLFKCGISWAGVTDIGLLFTGNRGFMSDVSERFRKYGMPELIGDPQRDAARFTATSPLHQAARIKQPLMLAYGSADRRVPLYHGEKFYAAVKKTNPNTEWIEYDGEGHGWTLPENRIDFWTRVEKFLDRNIGKP